MDEVEGLVAALNATLAGINEILTAMRKAELMILVGEEIAKREMAAYCSQRRRPGRKRGGASLTRVK